MPKSDSDRAEAVLADPRWPAVAGRDRSADGRFVYAVTTTGVYCRPGCGARRPLPAHVRFFDGPASAERAGFRPCRRCRPDRPAGVSRQAVLVAELCRRIDRAEQPPTLAELSRQSGFSPYHLQRVFKQVTGVSPRDYALARRAERLRLALEGGAAVTDACYRAGYRSSGGFYRDAPAALGMTPGAYRAGGAGETIRFAIGQCSLGAILVAASQRGLCAIELGDAADAVLQQLQRRFDRATLVGADPDFEQWVAQVIALIEAPATGLALPLDIRGTAFQVRVWQALRDIPPGQTASYAEIARRIGQPRAVRAVAGACAANALAVVIPCHRVVRTDGALSGYRWGIERKRALLAREAAPQPERKETPGLDDAQTSAASGCAQ